MNNDKDAPIASDYKKSVEGQGLQLPNFLTSGTGVLIGLGIVIIVTALVWVFTNVSLSRPAPNPLESRSGYASLKKNVENIADVDQICLKSDRASCLCELSDRLRDDHRAIDQIIAADPGLRDFNIAVVRAGSPTLMYSLAKLPKAPGETECLNTVAAPTILDADETAVQTTPTESGDAPAPVPAPSEPAAEASDSSTAVHR